ncbi:MAG: YihY family inner membrane protein [Chitinivibrionales bacterium]|nr:YihY family inner membrane protein [Chitinivibrionales bacterium]MBD3397434.1 YihY family inner membrane protein [Chitinivibrionales bacterium]
MDGIQVRRRWHQGAGTVWAVIKRSVRGMLDERGPEAAAGIAFFTQFSLFPLLVVLISGAALVFPEHTVREIILDAVRRIAPAASHEFVSRNMVRILERRVSMSVFGVVGLLWAASGMFAALSRNLSRAWPEAQARGIVRARLVAIVIVLVLFATLVLFLVMQAAFNLVAGGEHFLGLHLAISFAQRALSHAAVYLFEFAALLLLYRLAPNALVRWREAAWGAAFALVCSQVTVYLASLYLGSGLVRHNVVYGALGSVVVSMFWIYAIDFVVLWGGHVSASVAAIVGHEKTQTERAGK